MGRKQKNLDRKSDTPAVQELVKAVLKDTDILQQSLLENDYDETPKGLNLIIPNNEPNSSEVASSSSTETVNSRPSEKSSNDRKGADFVNVNASLSDLEFISYRLKNNPKFLEIISSKISDYIISNGDFRQLVCNSVKLDFSNDFKKMQAHIDELEKNYNILQVTVNKS